MKEGKTIETPWTNLYRRRRNVNPIKVGKVRIEKEMGYASTGSKSSNFSSRVINIIILSAEVDAMRGQ